MNRIKMMKVTRGSDTVDVSRKQVKVMRDLGFSPSELRVVNGLRYIQWKRIFGTDYSAEIVIWLPCVAEVSHREAVRLIVVASYRQCEFDVMQRLCGPRLYFKLNS